MEKKMYRCSYIYDLAEYLKDQLKGPGDINRILAFKEHDGVIISDTFILTKLSKDEFNDISNLGILREEDLEHFLSRGKEIGGSIKQRISRLLNKTDPDHPELGEDLKEVKLTDLCINKARVYKVEDKICAVSTDFNFMLYYRKKIKTEGPNRGLHVLDNKNRLVGIVMPLSSPLSDGNTVEGELKSRLKDIGLIERWCSK